MRFVLILPFGGALHYFQARALRSKYCRKSFRELLDLRNQNLKYHLCAMQFIQ